MLTPGVSLAYYRVMGGAKYLQRARTVKFTLFYWKHTKQVLYETQLITINYHCFVHAFVWQPR